MEFENLLKLVACVSQSELQSFYYEQGGTVIRLKKDRRGGKGGSLAASGILGEPGAPGVPASNIYGDVPEDTQENFADGFRKNPPEESAGQTAVRGKEIKSPLVGVFYTAPGEDAPPFVAVGDPVKKGQTLGIVEAMKLMNEIESECDGVVAKISAENGQTVEYGQTLFVIAPDKM